MTRRLLVALIVLLLTTVAVPRVRTQSQAAPTAPGVIRIDDCNDPDNRDIPCLEPTQALIDQAHSNGYPYYIGHAEPTMLFFSTAGASGSNMQWKLSLPATEPSPDQAGTKIANFELYSTFWLGLALCDPHSTPFGACVAASDTNNPSTAGAAFLELQFYPPGINCSTTQWCVALHINTLQDPSACREPTTTAFLTTDGNPAHTKLLMNNGDTLVVTIQDTASGLSTIVSDTTAGTSGSMVASGANGYLHNKNTTDCTTEAFDFHAMYNTASPGQVVPWASLGPNVSWDFEIGHWELCKDAACTAGNLPDNDPATDDGGCQTVRGLGGCFNSDTDHDGTSYAADWPDGTANHPASVVLSAPNDEGIGPLSAATTGNAGPYDEGYKAITFQTTESTTAPFYPFFSQAGTGTACRFDFGNDLPATTNDFSKAAQYSTSIQNPCFPAPDLTITKSHVGKFTQGDTADTFTITVSNAGSTATSGTVSVTDALPPSLTAAAMTGTGWSCNVATTTCTRADALNGGASYPAITLTVGVANNAPLSVTNSVTVSGGNEASNVSGDDTATDSVTIIQHTVTTVQPAIGDYHDQITLQAAVAPAGVTGTVQFFVNGVSVGFATYNSGSGAASIPYTDTTLAAGPYSLEADFTSTDSDYLSSKGVLPNGLTVTLEEDTLSYTGDTVIANGSTAQMSGVLLEDGTTAIAGRSVKFTLGTGSGAQTCSGTTNASGVASCSIASVAQPLGPGTVRDDFTSDGFYQTSSATASTIMFAFLTTGGEVIGDQNAASGTPVTFWGAQWSTLNALSGGIAPASFKGFAASTGEPPKCGSIWSTRTGNSSGPPAMLPSYMGVLVSSAVGQTGSTVAGDVAKIVVVQTNGGYAPDPGHPGTGVVVALYCHK